MSADGGRTWAQAELAVRAWDSAGQTQPALPDEAWNFEGDLSTAWDRVLVSAL